MPRGILKNAHTDAAYRTESPNELDREKAVFDRQKVIENTRLNAQLSHGKGIPGLQHIEQKKERGEALSEEEQLRWDERNLLVNEMEKSATMKIDEPKTPYEGGFDPNNDYYRTDNEVDGDGAEGADGDADQEDAFELGEGLDDADDVKKGQIEVVGGEAPEAPASEVPDAAEPSAEEKHRIFEEKRKQHYHLKAAPLKEHHGLAVDDDEADEDQA